MKVLANNQMRVQAEEVGHEQWYRENHAIIADVEFRSPEPKIRNAQFTEQNVHFMVYNGHPFRNLQVRGASYVQMETDFKKNENKQYMLNLDHCSTLINGVPSSKITITVNGQTVIQGYNASVGGGNFLQEQLEITPFLQDGHNTVRIQLDDDSMSRYWIQALSIVEK